MAKIEYLLSTRARQKYSNLWLGSSKPVYVIYISDLTMGFKIHLEPRKYRGHLISIPNIDPEVSKPQIHQVSQSEKPGGHTLYTLFYNILLA